MLFQQLEFQQESCLLMWKIRWRNLINFCLKKTKKIDIIEAIETDQDMVIDIDDQDLDLLLLIVDILGHLQTLTGKNIYTGMHVFGFTY